MKPEQLPGGPPVAVAWLQEALEKIERLQAEVERLRAALAEYERTKPLRKRGCKGLVDQLCALDAENESLKADLDRRDSDLARLDMDKVLAPTIELLERVQVCTVGRTTECHPEARHEITRLKAIVEAGK
mgnify:CR=1 FL=1